DGTRAAGRPGRCHRRPGQHRRHAEGQQPGRGGGNRAGQFAPGGQPGRAEGQARDDPAADRRFLPRRLCSCRLIMRRLSTTEADFDARLAELLAFESAQDPQVAVAVAAILADVKARGDAAVLEYTARFDGVSAKSPDELEIPQAELRAALKRIPA